MENTFFRKKTSDTKLWSYDTKLKKNQAEGLIKTTHRRPDCVAQILKSATESEKNCFRPNRVEETEKEGEKKEYKSYKMMSSANR